MIAVPGAMPVTKPEATVATAALLLVQAPPPVASVSVTLLPAHIVADEGVIAAAPTETEMVLVTVQVPTE